MGRVVKGPGHRVPAAVLDARAQADAIVAAAHAQAAGVRAEAAAAGRDDAAAVVTKTLLDVRAEAERTLIAARPAAAALAARMAARIVGRAVELAPSVTAEIATQALQAARARGGRIKLRVHPDDRAALSAATTQLLARLAATATLELVDDPGVGRHGCIVETSAGRLDARLETQLGVLEKAAAGSVGVGDGDEAARG